MKSMIATKHDNTGRGPGRTRVIATSHTGRGRKNSGGNERFGLGAEEYPERFARQRIAGRLYIVRPMNATALWDSARRVSYSFPTQKREVFNESWRQPDQALNLARRGHRLSGHYW